MVYKYTFDVVYTQLKPKTCYNIPCLSKANGKTISVFPLTLKKNIEAISWVNRRLR